MDRRGSRKLAEAFVRFLFILVTQKVFVNNGFRPLTPEGKVYARGKFQDF
jgi:ABC-type sulfate transport system substrate-binding protein